MIRWCLVPEIWCTTDGRTDRRMDQWKMWHIEVCHPKTEIKKKKKNKKLVATLGFECWTSFPKSAPAKFSGHKSCESRDVKFSNCQTTSQWSYNQRVMRIYGWEFFMVCCHLEKFCGHRHCDSENMYLLFHKNSEDNLIDGSC